MENTFVISAPEIYSFSETRWYLDRGFDDCSHKADESAVVKAIRYGDELLLFRVSGGNDLLHVQILSGPHTPEVQRHIHDYIRRWFDLDLDISPFYELLQKDPRVAFMAEAFYGFRMVAINELFEALCWSIIGQQINLAFAFRMKRRLTEKYGDSVEFGDQVYLVFPKPEILAAIDPEELRPMQFSQRKAEYMIGLARLFANGTLSEQLISDLPDFAAKQKMLTDIRGIGIWTANYALMKSMHIPEAVPYGDAGLFIALTDLGIIDNRKETEKIGHFFDRFSGWQHYMVYYLWRSRAFKLTGK